jgi:NitT/TauT family transport system substrate-binding protein
VAIGKTDVQLNGVYQTLSHISQGTNVVIFAGTAAEGSTAIARSEDADRLRDLKNWKGVKVAHTRFNNADFVTRGKVRDAGVDIDTEVEYIAFDDTTLVVQAVAKGAADVAVVTNESLTMAKSIGLEIVFSVGEIAPMYVCCRHTGNKAAVEENRQTYVNLLIAELRALKVYREDQDKVIEIMTELSREDEEYVYNYLYSPESSSPLTLDPSLKKVKDLYTLLEGWGYVQPGVKIEDSVDITIYKDALDEVIRRYPDDPLYKDLLEDYARNNI